MRSLTSSDVIALTTIFTIQGSIHAFSRMAGPSTTQFVTNKMCPFAQKAWIALEVVNAPYELKEISLYGVNGKPDWFLKMNPAGTVPVLSCNGGIVVVPDSELILNYIADGAVEGGSQLQSPSSEEAVKKWRKDISDRVIPIGKEAVLGGSRELFSILQEVDKNVQLPYLCGDQITTADCAAFPFLWRLDQEFGPLTQGDHGCGNLRSWLDQCDSTSSFKKTVQTNWWWWW